ncbi:hypothetical protein FCL40_08150 [Ferrimonas sediminicola]|uniref:L,D-TPase catalytic domain-containing protein n=1 Tax=Ferrimonas sediminicola TaxID=2569538 RepID=A0A4U1BEL8_9GAMM|nr:L,D-transpeptidase family protein [Ferrimonas sediminicola]TKB49298.1 hypothetical protein FCL40_08150 [Ferrimonas sediminicola]
MGNTLATLATVVMMVLAPLAAPLAQGLAAKRLESALARMPGGNLPVQLTLVAIKSEYRMEVWGADVDNSWYRLRTYPIMGFSGGPGPKLREGDLQVPEGVYRPLALNPNSRYHLSVKLNYPNGLDRHFAREEGRTNPGGDIFIHGDKASSGCLAMGNTAIEEIYHLVEQVGLGDTQVVITPVDPRTTQLRPWPSSPAWTEHKYRRIRDTLAALRHKKSSPEAASASVSAPIRQ